VRTMQTKLKKITLPILTGIISLYISVLFCFGIIIGYVLMKYLSSKVKSIEFSLGNYKIHLHHWLYSSLVLTAMLITDIYSFLPALILGVGGGFVFQGIYSYDDWYKILKRKR